MEQEPKLSVTEQILNTAQFIEKEGRNPEYVLKFGGKKLTVMLIKGGTETMTFIENTSDVLETGATTELYKAANIIMQRIADEQQKTFLYIDRTKDDRMREWFQSKGNEIFGWDSMDVDPTPQVDSIFTKQFSPKM